MRFAVAVVAALVISYKRGGGDIHAEKEEHTGVSRQGIDEYEARNTFEVQQTGRRQHAQVGGQTTFTLYDSDYGVNAKEHGNDYRYGYGSGSKGSKSGSKSRKGASKASSKGFYDDSYGSKGSKSSYYNHASKPTPSKPVSRPTPKPIYQPRPTPTLMPITPTEQPAEPTPIQRDLSLWRLDYTVTENRNADSDETDKITALTDAFLSDYFFALYPGSLVEFLVEFRGRRFGPGQPLEFIYDTILFFDGDSSDIPTTAELDELLQQAFTGDSLDEYTSQVQQLPTTNIFSTTTLITYVEDINA